jgi:hypothetical protein
MYLELTMDLMDFQDDPSVVVTDLLDQQDTLVEKAFYSL